MPARLLCSWASPGKNTGVGCHALLHGNFPTQGSNLGLSPCRRILDYLSHQGSRMHSAICPAWFDHTLAWGTIWWSELSYLDKGGWLANAKEPPVVPTSNGSSLDYSKHTAYFPGWNTVDIPSHQPRNGIYVNLFKKGLSLSLKPHSGSFLWCRILPLSCSILRSSILRTTFPVVSREMG